MSITQTDVDNIHKMETYLKTPHTIGDIATHLGVSKSKAIDYLEIMAKNPKRYRLGCGDLGGQEKKWVLE